MQSTEDNLYKAPEANLVSNVEGEHPILKFKRFSTWATFGLSLITAGIYNIYWLVSRTKTTNLVLEKQASLIPANIAFGSQLAATILPMLAAGGLIPVSHDQVIFGAGTFAILNIVAVVFMIYSLYTLRNRLVEITNIGSSNPEKMGGIKTFFLNVFFLNYRINKSIDLQKGIASAMENVPEEIKKQHN